MPAAPRTGTRLALPAGAAPPYTVYVNGVERHEGRDYTVSGDRLCFNDPLVCVRPEGLLKKLIMSTAGFGFYTKADVVDVHFVDRDGTPVAASGLQVEPQGDSASA